MTFCQVSDGDVVPKDIVLLNLGPQFWLFCFHWIHWTTQRKSDDLVVSDLMVLNLLFSDVLPWLLGGQHSSSSRLFLAKTTTDDDDPPRRLMRALKSLRAIRMMRSFRLFRGLRLLAPWRNPRTPTHQIFRGRPGWSFCYGIHAYFVPVVATFRQQHQVFQWWTSARLGKNVNL